MAEATVSRRLPSQALSLRTLLTPERTENRQEKCLSKVLTLNCQHSDADEIVSAGFAHAAKGFRQGVD